MSICECHAIKHPLHHNLTALSTLSDSRIFKCTKCGSFWELHDGAWDLMLENNSYQPDKESKHGNAFYSSPSD